jgi:hypothetical protein
MALILSFINPPPSFQLHLYFPCSSCMIIICVWQGMSKIHWIFGKFLPFSTQNLRLKDHLKKGQKGTKIRINVLNFLSQLLQTRKILRAHYFKGNTFFSLWVFRISNTGPLICQSFTISNQKALGLFFYIAWFILSFPNSPLYDDLKDNN